jgi:glutamate synthase domain-containing protein 3
MVNEEKAIAEIGVKFLPRVKVENDVWRINADGICYRDLNTLLRALNHNGARKIEIHNIYGQRYIGTDLEGNTEIDVYGTPGNDLGAFLNGPRLVIHGNVQDGCGNTMNEGQIVVHGRAGDITGYSMRDGKIYVRDDAGYRVGIHMKEYCSKKPYLVVGGTAQDFLGEYMAGGVLVVLGLTLKPGKSHRAKFVGTGMHGGIIYICGEISHLGREVEIMDVNEGDLYLIQSLVKEFCGYFDFDFDEIMNRKFAKIIPVSHRPYGKLYVY